MSTLWTPDGERRPGDDEPAAGVAPGFEDVELDADAEAHAAEMAGEMAEIRRQLAETPASVVVANHLMGLYELAAIHLGQDPPNFAESSVAIDAMAAVVDALPGRLGENEQVLKDALGQLRLTYVQVRSAVQQSEQQAEGDDAGTGDPE